MSSGLSDAFKRASGTCWSSEIVPLSFEEAAIPDGTAGSEDRRGVCTIEKEGKPRRCGSAELACDADRTLPSQTYALRKRPERPGRPMCVPRADGREKRTKAARSDRTRVA